MADYSNDLVYADQRLRESIALVYGVPKMILRVKMNGTVDYRSIGGNGLFGFCMFEDLDYTNIPLGFMNTCRSCRYVARTNKKQYKQGLTNNNLIDMITGHGVSIESPHLVETIMGIYPTLSDCIEQIECDEADKRAFHRTYAIGSKEVGGRFKLFHKRWEIGTVAITDYGQINVELKDEFTYLAEDVAENVQANR